VAPILDLCVKFFQEFVTWKISQNERKPEPALPSAADIYIKNRLIFGLNKQPK
jgi:hypothetical protein